MVMIRMPISLGRLKPKQMQALQCAQALEKGFVL
ncbi:hypothetical protein V466_18760 [Pseudomonas mandelii PD30]|uniref:Uncharacterized protein n=1 Tax=Pseudomonas mandelii PD30 TaxID=1419583 RepID=A0A059L067_9PSED|nr:hypothetical protein V466_18760 [Pseudomonas mandelii PD30]